MSELQNLIEMGISDLDEWIKDNPYEVNPDDFIWETADSLTPVYNYNIMQIAKDNINEIALYEIEIEPQHQTALDVAKIAIYEYILFALWDHWHNKRDDILEEWRQDIITWIEDILKDNPELDFSNCYDPETKLWIDSIESELSLDRDFIHETIEDNF